MNLNDQLTPDDVKKVLKLLGITQKGNSWKTIKSPLRTDQKPSFGINLNTGAWKDHANGETGDIITLTAQILGMSNSEAMHWIKNQCNLHKHQSLPPKARFHKAKHDSFWTSELKEEIKQSQDYLAKNPNHPLIQKVKDYDCLNFETLKAYNVGIIFKWDQFWLAFPYESGVQLYRRENGEKVIRSLPGSKPGNSFYGIKQTVGKKQLFITKSPRECMLLSQEFNDCADTIGLCTGEQGTISKKQFKALTRQISKSNYSEIYVFLDCDTATAYNTAKHFTNEVGRIAGNQNISLVNIHKSTGGAYKDLTDCIRDEMDEESFQMLLKDATRAKRATKAKGNALNIDQKFDISTAPRIPAVVYENLPRMLQTRCDLIEHAHRRDVFLVSALPVLAAHMLNVKAAHADGYYTPDLSTLIVADPGAGKGTATKAKLMGNTLHKKLMDQSRQKIAEYNALPDEAKATLSEPMEQCLFIPANSSSRAIYDVLQANGGWGLLFETEIDTMLNATGQEWGDFTDITRKSFHHETISINRKGEKFFIDEPRLSICLTGTFDQFKKMFESAENGHFSRYALFTFQVQRTWRSHRPTKSSRALDESILIASDGLYDMYNILNRRTEPLYIDLHTQQWQMIDDTFAEKMQIIEDLDLSSYLHASNNRAAVLALRMAGMFAVLRTFETNSNHLYALKTITPDKSDMIAALGLADTFIKHAIRLYNILPGATDSDRKGERYKKFISMVPNEFDISEAYGIAESLKIPKRTVRHWLSNENSIKRIQRGQYQKI